MKSLIKKFFDNEILSYLFFGLATTLVSILSRLVIYQLTHKELLATALANIIGILFAFITNDTIVFKQTRKNRLIRLLKFSLARLSTFLLDLFLTFLFVSQFPNIIGQFVNDNIDKVNSIETVYVENEDNPDFFEVRSCRNGKTMVIAGPEQNQLFWRKHTSIKKDVEEANGIPQKAKGQKYLFYAVISVEYTGFVRIWDKCKELTHGKSAKFKGFNSIEAAKQWMRENNAPSITFERYKEVKDIK